MRNSARHISYCLHGRIDLFCAIQGYSVNQSLRVNQSVIISSAGLEEGGWATVIFVSQRRFFSAEPFVVVFDSLFCFLKEKC